MIRRIIRTGGDSFSLVNNLNREIGDEET